MSLASLGYVFRNGQGKRAVPGWEGIVLEIVKGVPAQKAHVWNFPMEIHTAF